LVNNDIDIYYWCFSYVLCQLVDGHHASNKENMDPIETDDLVA
jgi:hypothetical protein